MSAQRKRLCSLLFLFSAIFSLWASGSQEAQQGITVTDSIGNHVVLPAPPERIVVAGKSTLITADTLFLFPEARGKVIGLGKTNQGLGDFFPYLDPNIGEITRIGHEVGPEQVIALKPDLFIVKDFVYEKLGAPVAKLGVPTIALSLETPSQYIDDIMIVGRIFGDTKRAEAINAYYADFLDRINKKVGKIPEQNKPSVLLLYYSNKGGETAFNISPVSWIQTAQVEKAGGKAVWKESNKGGGWKTVNFEQIAAWDPDYIFITSFNSDSSDFLPGILADTTWQQLRAAKAGRVKAVPSDFHSWAQPDTRWILCIGWMAKTLYPEEFSDMKISDEVIRFYNELYHLDRSVIEEVVLPRLEGEIAD
ncbi:ABC transporter substrate-binding protein [Sediminispirochaeta smaragdinae]|uniref:Periplasmic binding protein n=1 Tax=Sediminispirochaeta smaragdinae (strain DSM 11293 / JCM 15392 / SEBR 4228) TaxID=573413 RepID=E1R3S3_SEDSS|nr:ABC transporter substrate-binding protein [Sediminispirochaeta smaragdinae]ADK82044.1 periplasmic binding protein [Sediminispirochaeta smaragdinae DSM 11293]